MNCKHVEELLPLYVGRDLEEERARLVTVHVQGCAQCARSAQEYGEVNQLLQLFEPPQFSEATFTAIRSRVLCEIERESSAPSLLEFLRRPFQPRTMWAVSTAVLLAVCVFAYYLIANRTSGVQHEQATATSQPDKSKDSPAPSNNDLKPASTGTASGLTSQATNAPKLRLNQKVWHSQRAGGAPAVPMKSVQYSPEPKGATPNTSVSSDKTLRVEIQTSDPNVRIIWFSHPSIPEGSPNESSKGI